MYPSSSSSSPQKSTVPSGLIRYGSAPGSLLNSAVESVIGTSREFSTLGSPLQPNLVGHYFSGDSSSLTSESTCKVSSSIDPKEHRKGALKRSYDLSEMAQSSAGGSSCLVRQKSSPAGFFSHLSTENGFSVTNVTENFSSQGCSNGRHGVSRLNSQLSFTRQDSLSQISEVNEGVINGTSNRHQNATHSYPPASFAMDSWENASSIVFSTQPNERVKNIEGDFFTCLNTLETQFSLPQTSLEMATVEKLLNIPEDSVPCKIRAKRGCATHPRSIAERVCH
ncbi:transcription factor bHLH128 [Carica papaya]|uniref:transcription factor bHLH128 n=1 Tax=Carica papaya TaxID=3649 RepID=UPI000B8D192B|nr:transcription factor bHLH128 [Carica papaya]